MSDPTPKPAWPLPVGTVFTWTVYANGSTTRGEWWLRDLDRHVAAAARFPNARIEAPNG